MMPNFRQFEIAVIKRRGTRTRTQDIRSARSYEAFGFEGILGIKISEAHFCLAGMPSTRCCTLLFFMLNHGRRRRSQGYPNIMTSVLKRSGMTENICSEVGVRELGLELRMLEEYRHAMSARCSLGYRPRSGLVLTSDILMDDRQHP